MKKVLSPDPLFLLLAFSLASVSVTYAMPLWLDMPARSNPNDPRSSNFMAQPTPTQANHGASPSATPSATNTTAASSPTPTPTATAISNGSWPLLSSFDANASFNNTGGLNSTGTDNDDGCGSSTSSASIAQMSSGGKDSSPYARFSFNVGTNSGCGYQYASYALAMGTTKNASAYNALSFWLRGSSAGQAFQIVLGTANDTCVPGKNSMYISLTATSSWQSYTIPFSSFSNKVPSCGFVADGDLSNLAMVAFVVNSVSSGSLDLDDVGFTSVAVPSNGAWPMLSNFNADVSHNNAAGTNSTTNDNQDGCGSSSSSANALQQTSGGKDSSPYLEFDYNVGTNSGCGYQYAAYSMPLVSPKSLSGTSGISFWVKASTAISFQVNLKGATSDVCLPGINQMNQNVSASKAWQQVSLPFSVFNPKNSACPFYNASSKSFSTNVGSISFVVTSLGSGSLYFDDISFY